MDMLTAVSADTINKLSPDAGIVMRDTDISAITDAAAMVTLIEANRKDPTKWVGVTDGGITVTEGRSFWSPSFDGKRMPYKGDKWLDTAEPKISFTLLEMTANNVKAASTAADISGTTPKVTVQPRASIQEGDYFKNIVFVTMVGHEGLYIVELDNALCTKGVDLSTGDKQVAKLAVEFTGHKEDPTQVDTLPIRYHFLSSSAAAASAGTEGEETGQAAAYDPETSAE